MKLSVIVPIFKVEKYLRKCVDSILHQDMDSGEYEIILVDDGSPDGCGAIADEYALAYANVRVIHRENGGLSAARNAGLAVAKGEYVQFVDSDDFLEPDVFGFLVNKMEADRLDVLRFNYQNVNERYEVYEPYKDVKPFVDFKDEVCNGRAFLDERLGYACYAVQFLIRRSMLADNGLYFKPGIRFEDTEWAPRMLLNAERVTSTDKVAYNYLLRPGSITNGSSTEAKRQVLEDKLRLISSLKEQMQVCSDIHWYGGMISLTALSTLTMLSSDFFKERQMYICRLREMGIFPMSSYHLSKRSARKARIANISPEMFCVVHHIKNLR